MLVWISNFAEETQAKDGGNGRWKISAKLNPPCCSSYSPDGTAVCDQRRLA
jgi:hypothetical protein